MKIKFFKWMNVVIVMIFIGSLTSCSDNEDIAMDSQSAVYQDEVFENSVMHTASSLDIIPEQAYPREALKGNSFKFKVKCYPGTGFANITVQIRFRAPSGELVNPINMVYKGTQNDGYAVFELERVLSQYGEYEFEYGFLYKGNFTKFPNTDTYTLIVLHPEITFDDTNYPYKNGNHTDSDKWGFIRRWCTSWVAYAVNTMWGTSTAFENNMNNSHLGWAKDWKDKLTSIGYKADNSPRVGDIAWWKWSQDRSHVAFVTKVESNGTITITEYNGTVPFGYTKRTVSKSQSYPHSFIHVQTRRW